MVKLGDAADALGGMNWDEVMAPFGDGISIDSYRSVCFLGCIMESWHIEGGGSVQLLEVGRLPNDLTEWKWQQKRHGAEYVRKEFVFLLLGLTSPCHPAICGDLSFGFSAKWPKCQDYLTAYGTFPSSIKVRSGSQTSN